MSDFIRRRDLACAAMISLTSFSAAFGQSQPEVTLAGAIQRAVRADPALAIAAAGVARAESSIRDAESSRLPSLQLDANVTRFSDPMVVAPLHGFDPRNPPINDRTLSQGTPTKS